MLTRLVLASLAMMLTTHPLAAQNESAQNEESPRQPPPHEGYGRGGRPADHLLERMREQHPEKYQRLAELREADPEAFGKEIRKLAQQRMLKRFLDASPRLREVFDALPADEQERILEAISRGEHAGGSSLPTALRGSRSRGRGMEPPHGQPPPDETDPQNNACVGRKPGARLSREDIAARYDQRTRFYEDEIQRISQQLQSLQRMLDERKTGRERVIDQLYQQHGKP